MSKNLAMLFNDAFKAKRPKSENARHARRAWKKRGHLKFSFSKLVFVKFPQSPNPALFIKISILIPSAFTLQYNSSAAPSFDKSIA